MGRVEGPPRLSAEALYERYERYRAEGADLRAGVAELEQICIENQRWGLAYDLLARLLELSGADERAYDAYRTGMEIGLRSRRLGRDLKADLVLKVINFCMARGWPERARSHLAELSEMAPRHPLVRALGERIGAGMGEDGAAFVADHMSRRRAVQTALRAARERFDAGAMEAARDLYRQAIDLDDRCTNGYIFLAQTYARLSGEPQAEGVVFFEDLVSRQPGWGLALNLLGQLYATVGRDEEAYEVLDRAANLSDTSPTLDRRRKEALRVELVDFCEARGWREQARQQRRRLARVSPRHPRAEDSEDEAARQAIAARLRRATELDDLGEIIEALRALVEREPRDKEAHVALSEAYRRAGGERLRAGVEWMERVVSVAPRWGLAWKLLADLRGAAGEVEGAYVALRETARLGGLSDRLPLQVRSDNLLALVDFCTQRGWFDRALAHVERLLDLQPDHAGARALEKLLRSRSGG